MLNQSLDSGVGRLMAFGKDMPKLFRHRQCRHVDGAPYWYIGKIQVSAYPQPLGQNSNMSPRSNGIDENDCSM